MREILFRGKRVDNDEWVYGDLIQCGITGKKYIFTTGSDANESTKVNEDGCLRLFAFEVAVETVCQYTGLDDKNGVKIFEGDIIQNTANTNWDKQIVKYGDCRNWILDGVGNKPFKASKCSCLVSCEAKSIFEVIGTIWDKSKGVD